MSGSRDDFAPSRLRFEQNDGYTAEKCVFTKTINCMNAYVARAQAKSGGIDAEMTEIQPRLPRESKADREFDALRASAHIDGGAISAQKCLAPPCEAAGSWWCILAAPICFDAIRKSKEQREDAGVLYV